MHSPFAMRVNRFCDATPCTPSPTVGFPVDRINQLILDFMGERRSSARSLILLVFEIAALIHPPVQPIGSLLTGFEEHFIRFRINELEANLRIQFWISPPQVVVR